MLLLWLGARYAGGPALIRAATPGLLHAHEMLFGFAAALVCGVLLTALPSWSGAGELRGRPLALLFTLWLAGRVVALAGDAVPPAVALLVDSALFPALFVLLTRSLAHARRRLFAWTIPPLVAFGIANVLFHLAIGRDDPAAARWALLLALHALAFLFTLYGGLFIPAFTRRFLHERGERAAAILMPLEYTTALAMLAFSAADLAGAPAPVMAAAACLATAVQGARAVRWRGWRTTSVPLLWCVHLGYAWLVVALALRGLAAVTTTVPPDAWIHAFTIGAYGMLKIGLMTRVSLRHTGRPLRVSAAMRVAFGMMFAAAVLRLMYSMHAAAEWAIGATAVLWAGAFLIWLVRHGWMLWSPSLPRTVH